MDPYYDDGYYEPYLDSNRLEDEDDIPLSWIDIDLDAKGEQAAAR